MITGLRLWMEDKGYERVSDFQGRAVRNVTDWQHLNLNYTAKARIDQEVCIKCGRCYAACEGLIRSDWETTDNNRRVRYSAG